MESIHALLWMAAICSAIIAAVFGFLGEIIGFGFASSIAYLACMILVLSIYVEALLWVIKFDWNDMPFFKATVAGILMAVLSYIVYAIFEWSLFYALFVLFATVSAVALSIGLIKTIFGS